MDNNIPKKLYKYCNINENTLDNIIKDQFFLSKATNLNDCLEMMGYLSKDIEIPNPIINNVNDYCNTLREITYIGSLTTECDNPALWANFTNNEGMCIEYETENFCKCPNCVDLKNIIQKVKYEDEKFDLYGEFVQMQGAGSEESYKNNANIMELFIRKDKSFEYEDEYRFIRLRDSDKNPIEIGHSRQDRDWGFAPVWNDNKPLSQNTKVIGIVKLNIKPSKIYLGYNISEEDKKKVISACENKNVEIHEAYHDSKDSKVKMRFR